MKYYIIEINYTGPNDLPDVDRIEISTEPARGNMDGEEKLTGWCGTTCDWAVYAHGVYESEAEARKAVGDIWEAVREVDLEDEEDRPGPEVVALFKPGKYEQMSEDETGHYILSLLDEVITSKTTDAEIEQFAAQWEEDANAEGYSMHSQLASMIELHRDGLREEEDND